MDQEMSRMMEREVEKSEKEKEELKQNINLIQLNTLKKNNLVNEFQEKLEWMTSQGVLTEKDKLKLGDKINELEEKIILFKKELIVKENDLERISNANLILQKQLEILEAKINNY